MKRRTALQFAIAALVAPMCALGQSLRRFRVGLLAGADEKSATPNKEQFIRGLRDLGYDIGRNLDFDIRYAGGDTSRYAPLTDELIALKPDVLVGLDSVAVVMKAKTSTIPIVLLTSTDPVADGLVRSLARPGTNLLPSTLSCSPRSSRRFRASVSSISKNRRTLRRAPDSSRPPRKQQARGV